MREVVSAANVTCLMREGRWRFPLFGVANSAAATRPKINMEEPQPLSFGGQTPAQEDLRGPGGILVRHDHCYTTGRHRRTVDI